MVEYGTEVVHILGYGPDDLIGSASYQRILIEISARIHKDIHVSAVAVHVAREHDTARIRVELCAQIIMEFHE